jgi:hypothetical protein
MHLPFSGFGREGRSRLRARSGTHNDFAATIGGWHGEQQNLARLIKLPIHNRVSSDQYFFLVAP